jgi:uncharacterized protein (DUF362 family)
MSIVSLINADTYETESLSQSLETLLAPLGGIKAIVQAGDRVLLKPNLLTGSRPGKECITRSEVVYCVAKMVQKAGGKPFLGDSPAFGSAMGVAKASGYLPWLTELQVPVVEFHGQKYETASEEFNHLRLSKEAMQADVVINLPKVKSHTQLTLTMGVKNLFGCVPGKMKAWWHVEAGKYPAKFAKMLVETARTINPNLTIIDGIIGHEGNGPSGGEPKKIGFLGAATDLFALDRAVVDILQVDPQLVPTILAATALGICPELESIDFPHAQPQDLSISDWRLPDRLMPIDFGLPRVFKSTFKHLYIKLIKEPMSDYA